MKPLEEPSLTKWSCKSLEANMRVLLVGATGFIGSSVLTKLHSEGIEGVGVARPIIVLNMVALAILEDR
jgi:hypothetical protein